MSMIIENIFSIFDPSSSYSSISWAILATSFIFINTNTFNNSNPIKNLTNNTLSFMANEITQLVENPLNTTKQIFLTLFTSALIMNNVAIFPFNFTPSAHISISFTVGISMWTSTMLFGWNNYFNNIMVHLTPLGTPNQLMNFMVLIEIASSIIRPITLSIRLSANMVAGHLLISLLSSFSIMTTQNLVLSSIPIISLISLEVGVSIVQAYVLITLIIIYQNETS